MMKKNKYLVTLLLGLSLQAAAQQKGFVFEGRVNMPDGTEVGLSVTTETEMSHELATAVVRNGRFTLKGSVDRPYVGMLTTNNLSLVDRNKWPQDSIKWTYTDVYVANDAYTVAPNLHVTGGRPQADFNDLQSMGGMRGDSVWIFIESHPRSVVSTWLANGLLQRAYNLTQTQIDRLGSTIQADPEDPAGYAKFTKSLAAARLTAIGMPLVSLQVRDINNATHELTDIVPKNGKYTLLDFWASWCGICLHAMPEVRELSQRYANELNVLGISIDTKDDAWRKGMEKHPEPWPQYCTTEAGYRDLTDKLQIGNGVPYYLLVSPEGRVVGSPANPMDAERMMLQAQGRYRITGTADSTVDGDTVYLCSMQGFFSMVPEDSTIVKGGKFEFTGRADGANLRYMLPMHGGEAKAMAPFIFEPGRVDMQIYSDMDRTTIDGGPNQRLWDAYEAADERYAEATNGPWDAANDSTASAESRAAAQLELDAARARQKDFHKRFLVENMPSAFSDMLYSFIADELSTQEQDSLLTLMGQLQPQYPVYKAIMAERTAAAATAIGQKYTDFTLPDPDGRMLSVSQYVTNNRYTLIDFWASWCGPCRAEMPNVVMAYDKYHKKGFEIVGVSLDNNKDAWLKAIKQMGMTWPQMSDLKGWQSSAASAYNVRAIPTNVLIDQQGNIIAKDLRDEGLQQKLAELFE